MDRQALLDRSAAGTERGKAEKAGLATGLDVHQAARGKDRE
jgi:hypothetical protein